MKRNIGRVSAFLIFLNLIFLLIYWVDQEGSQRTWKVDAYCQESVAGQGYEDQLFDALTEAALSKREAETVEGIIFYLMDPKECAESFHYEGAKVYLRADEHLKETVNAVLREILEVK